MSPQPSLAKRLIVGTLDRVWPSAMLELYLRTRSSHCEPELWLVPSLLKSGGTALDIGANMGLWSRQLHRYADVVHAFEPNPICLRQLHRVLPLNAVLHAVALSDREGIAHLRFDPENTGIGTIEARNTLAQNAGVAVVREAEVPTRTLDSLGLTGVAFIKIDVEGHEEAVLAGGENLLTSDKPSIVCEIEERHNAGGLDRVRAGLARLGYRALALHGGKPTAFETLAREPGVRLAVAGGINNFIFVHPDRLTGFGADIAGALS